MNIVERIYKKYPANYCMIPPKFSRSFSLTFGDGLEQLQQKVLENLDRFGLDAEDSGIAFALTQEREGVYLLTQNGEALYRFADRAGRADFYAYDPSDAIAWVIYILSTNKNWLDDAPKGWFISCRSFCAQQQAVAARFQECVNAQYKTTSTSDLVIDILRFLNKPLDVFCKKAPMFSARPLRPEAYSEYLGKNVTESLDVLCGKIFYRGSFLAELDAYHNMVKSLDLYQTRLQECAEWLAQKAYEQPFMSLSGFFSSLLNQIEQLDPVKPSIDRHKKVNFTLSPDGLNEAFGALDKAYDTYISASIRQDFMRSVCEAAKTLVDQTISDARSAVKETSRQLSSFCFVDEAAIPEDYRDQKLGWRQLIAPSEADISMNSQVWTPESWKGMQRHFLDYYPPLFWLCSEKLRNLSEIQHLPDASRTNAIPAAGDQYIWALWVDGQID